LSNPFAKLYRCNFKGVKNMIQFRRGSTSSWTKQKKPLADGQPGYDKERSKLKIGDGKSAWEDLPDTSGLRMEEILLSEADAKKRAVGLLNPLELLRKMFKLVGRPIITYGPEAPDKNTLGQVYLQYYDAEPEVDYVVSSAHVPGSWSYQKWRSGIARCSRIIEFTTSVQSAVGDSLLYQNSTDMKQLDYPILFSEVPSETATIQSPGGLVWLTTAKNGLNTNKHTASYTILSTDKLDNSTTFKISIQVEGRWR
jgi:hypothetical protein